MSSSNPPLGIYIHVPFCAARCGYCDFNTYVSDSADQQRAYVDAALIELRQARAELGARTAQSVFFGGGTPTLIGATQLVRLLDGVRDTFGLDRHAEVTTEANPESVGPHTFQTLRAAGFTRISLGMQSATPHVLRTLDRAHTPGRAVAAVLEARGAGFEHVSLDLIYGTPGETDADWEMTVNAAIDAGTDHISAYALTIHPGTALGAAVKYGRLPAPDDEAQARRFEIIDERLHAAGFDWYEISSWAHGEDARCRHNLGYWRSYDWWGVGPGAHSHVNGVRWWNVLRPAAYAGRLRAGDAPAAEREVLSADDRALETVLLGLRTREGLPLAALSAAGVRAAHQQIEQGRLVLRGDRIEPTRNGRLFADMLARELSV